MTETSRWRGVFAVLLSPFGADDSLNVADLRAQVDFASACRVNGVVFPGVASEFYALSNAERRRGLEAVIEQAGGQLPVLAGVTGSSGSHAADLAQHAAQAGASGAMVMAPPLLRLGEAGLLAYFTAVAEASNLPLMLQSYVPPVGVQLTTSQVVQLVSQVPSIRYVKQEAPPTPHNVSATLDALGDMVAGVFGGAGGLHAVEEMRRGACGTMPGVHLAAAAMAMWEAFAHGDEQQARLVHRALLPAVNRSLLLGPGFAKALLVHRGVLSSATARAPAPPADKYDEVELQHVLEDLAPYWPASAFGGRSIEA